MRLPHHRQQQGQQAGAIGGGALEPDHQRILQGLGPQARPGSFDQIGHGLSIELAAAPGHQAGQQLMGTAATRRIGAAAAADRQPGREDGRSLTPQQPHRKSAGQAERLRLGGKVGFDHAGTASRM